MKFTRLFVMIFIVSNVFASHPSLLTQDSEKTQIKKKIAQNKWAANCYKNVKSTVDKYVTQHKTDPEWITSRLQMYWKNMYKDVYVNGAVFSHGDGKAPVPTPKFAGGRDWSVPYASPPLKNIKPYLDDERGMWLQNNSKPGKPWEWAPISKTGQVIERINAGIMGLAQNAAFIYWLTGDEDYAKFAADIFWTYTNGMYHRNNPKTYENHRSKGIIGLATFEVIHEGVTVPLAITYDYLHDYLVKQGKDISIVEDVLRRWSDRIIEGGGSKGNWNINQVRFILYMGLTLQDNSAYPDGKGKQYYLDSFLTKSRPNQKALVDVIDDEYDPDQAVWPEAPGYAFGVTQMILRLAHLVSNATGQDVLLDYPIVEKAYLGYFQSIFPNGYSAGFGDTYHQRPENSALEYLLALYTKRGDKPAAQNISIVLKDQIKNGYNRLNLRTILALTSYVDKLPSTGSKKSDLSTPTYYSRPVNLFFQRNGGDPKTALACTLSGTAGGHNHPSGMAMELYGLGMVMAPDSGRGSSYWQAEQGEYYVRPPAHNTVVVDGISNYSVRRPQRHGAFRVVSCEPLSEATLRINSNISFLDAAFLDPKTQSDQRRLLSLVRTSEKYGYYIDIFRSARRDGKDKFHDYILHGVGDLESIDDAQAKAINLKDSTMLTTKNGLMKAYDYFKEEKSISYDKDLTATISAPINAKETANLKMWVDGSKDRTIFSVKAPKSRAVIKGSVPSALRENPLAGIIVRQNGPAWDNPFVVVYHPYLKEKGSYINKIENISTQPGLVAIKVVCKNSTQYILNSAYDYQRFTVNDITFEGSYAVVSYKNSGKLDYIYLGKGRYLAAGDYRIEGRDKMVSAGINFSQNQITVSTDQSVRIAVPAKSKATKITLGDTAPTVNYTKHPKSGFIASFNVEKCNDLTVKILN